MPRYFRLPWRLELQYCAKLQQMIVLDTIDYLISGHSLTLVMPSTERSLSAATFKGPGDGGVLGVSLVEQAHRCFPLLVGCNV
jgi:hypothetical protein